MHSIDKGAIGEQLDEMIKAMRMASYEIEILRDDFAALVDFWRWCPRHVTAEFRECKPVTADRIARIMREMEKSC